MADTAYLTSAHSHARRAGSQTAKGNWDVAAEEHSQAAMEFSKASRTTSDREALRILKLLEVQHERIAQIIRSKDEVIAIEPTTESEAVVSPVAGVPLTPDAVPTATKVARPKSSVRESSPSLAREIATRRGIPPVQVSSSAAAQARARQLSTDSTKRVVTAPQPRIPASLIDASAVSSSSRAADDGFSSFYNNLTSGTMSKLTSVLAYAGLPLTVEPEPPARSTRNVKASQEPDVKRIYSKATLNAIEDEHRKRGHKGQAFGPTESFYMVQTSGGTLSYADITKAQTQTTAIGGDDEDAFVDAQEAQPPSLKHNRSASKQQQQQQQQQRRNEFGNPRTSEELELENTTLKQTLEQLASRLANFEVHAQDASMAALTQSVANLHHPADTSGQERIQVLEKHIEQQAEQREKLEELAKKQERKIRAYHAKWEEIKKNAREKEKTKREQQADVDGKSSIV